MTSMTLNQFRAARVVPVLRSVDVATAVDTSTRLAAAGLTVIELTTSTPGWPEAVRHLRAEHRDLSIGVGTVTTAAEARTALQAGAMFLVSPYAAKDVYAVAADAGVLYWQGAFSPSEVAAAAEHGPVKLFPAHVGGPAYLKSLRAVLPEAMIMPTGGIAVDEVDKYLAAGAVAVGMGEALIADPDRALAQLTAAG